MNRPFRFGVLAAASGTGAEWTGRARAVADLGFAVLLTPDTLDTHAPLVALATAAAAVPELRVGPFVLAAPLRPPDAVAWEARSMTALTDGRFELGLGTGRPAAGSDAERLGLPWGSGRERLAALQATLAAVRAGERAHQGMVRTPLVVAASGPRALAAAARDADTVALAAPPTATREQVAAMAASLRGHPVEIATSLFAVGDRLPPDAARWAGPDAVRILRDPRCPARLRGSVATMAGELRRRRDEWGASYVVVGEAYARALAPVVARLAGT
ncbi:LLM class flavin-dependent oxidoreductase [Pseudonocardia tropica]|uniref:LLM class flavin-dependent oxidoreductase n=1 Tax=Pseudonocardia tropica TaxID=681289 RepID=A0ABV1JPZ0_9PSEU